MSEAGEGMAVSDAEGAPTPVPDERLLESHELARTALLSITSAQSIGDVVGYTVEGEHVLSLRFENRMLGYPGWFWTVTIARVEGSEPTVLETELMPGEGALLAPEWVPWAVRLADYQAAQATAAAERLAAGEEGDDDSDELDDDLDLDDDDDDDEDDFETDGSAILHSGDLDGVDIDPDDDDDESDDDDDDENDDDSDDESGEDENGFIEDSDDPEGTDRSY